MQCSRILRSSLLYHQGYATGLFIQGPGLLRSSSAPGLFSHGTRQSKRRFGLASIPGVLLPPVVFGGLLITLWTYKCLMMIVFQNKIIYMPSMPPFSRSEKVEDFASACKPIIWTESFIKSLDGTDLALLEGTQEEKFDETLVPAQKQVVVLYLQGNASSLPPRLPYLSNVLKLIRSQHPGVDYRIVCLSYRGFWKSRGRPNQPGIELDAQAALRWLEGRYAGRNDVKVVIWGQSIGAGVATTALATWLSRKVEKPRDKCLRVTGLLLETPFTSLRAMLTALYPQKFLPYRYLGPFLQSTWDSQAALESIGEQLGSSARALREEQLRVLLLEAGDDELVPEGDAHRLLEVCEKFTQISAEYRTVTGALHTNIMMKAEGKRRIVQFLEDVTAKSGSSQPLM